MFEVQRKDAMQYYFFDIQYAQGFWWAWYIKAAKTDTKRIDIVNNLRGD
jgi:hypothetical protein